MRLSYTFVLQKASYLATDVVYRLNMRVCRPGIATIGDVHILMELH